MMSFQEIGDELGITELQAIRIYMGAMKKLRARTPPSAQAAYQALIEDEPEWHNAQMEELVTELESGWGWHIEDSIGEVG